MNEPLVTVVVPVYKVEHQLRRCIDSIINQTYHNLEIILIDDGSPDNCPRICDEYALKDPRIKVIHKQNEGLGFARNTGIENASGKYICFFDSDDYIEPTTIDESCSQAQRYNADLVCFGHIEETDSGRVIAERLPRIPKELFVGDEITDAVIPMTLAHNSGTGEDWNLSLSAWCALFSMDVIRAHKWRFVSERECISEDVYSVLEYYSYVHTVAYIKKAFYHYISNPMSLSKAYRRDRYEKLKVLAERMFELTERIGLETTLSYRVRTIFLGLTIGAAKQITASNEAFHIKYKLVKEIVRDDYMQQILEQYNFSGEKLSKRVLLWSIKNKCCALSYCLFKIKSCLENR